jgi:hypothetical protein
MHQPIITAPERQPGRLSDGAFAGLAAALAFLAYFVVFLIVGDDGVLDAAASSLSNLIPLAIVSSAARPIMARYLIGRSLARQLIGHVALGASYSLLLYWMLMVLIGARQGDSFTEFVVRAFFPTGAIAWQLLQGVTFYALVASLTYQRARPSSEGPVFSAPVEALGKDPILSRYFIRTGDDIHPIDVSQIVSIAGADDYAEVTTLNGRHLVKMTLAEFEATLDGGSFIRVHRSRIVNVDRISRAEPAGGGRMLLHMENGEMIQASRAGSKLLRDRMI